MMPLTLAPRLYLDTALLIGLAEGQVAASLHEELLRAVRLSGAVLVLSEAHLFDLSQAEDASSNDRVFAAIDEFPRLALAAAPTLSEQAFLEPYARNRDPSLGWAELKLNPITSIRQYISRSPERFLRMRMARRLFSMMSGAIALLKSECSLTPSLSARTRREIGSTHFTDVLRRGTSESIIPTLQAKLSDVGVSEDNVAELLRPISPLIDMLSSPEASASFIRNEAARVGIDAIAAETIQANFNAWIAGGSVLDRAVDSIRDEVETYGGTADELARTLKKQTDRAQAPYSWASVAGGEALWHEIAPSVAPGSYLQATLTRVRVLDRQSKPLDSDWMDAVHATFLPYVDVATVDKANHNKLEPIMKLIRSKNGMRRPVRLLRNGSHESLIECVRALS